MVFLPPACLLLRLRPLCPCGPCTCREWVGRSSRAMEILTSWLCGFCGRGREAWWVERWCQGLGGQSSASDGSVTCQPVSSAPADCLLRAPTGSPWSLALALSGIHSLPQCTCRLPSQGSCWEPLEPGFGTVWLTLCPCCICLRAQEGDRLN